MKLIKVYKPHDIEPNRKPEWNTGLYVVEYKDKKYQFWSRREAVEKAVSLSLIGKEIIMEMTSNE